MPVTPPSLLAWPVVAALTAIFLPLAAALYAGRSVRDDPVARIALGWAVLGMLNLLGIVQYLRLLPRSFAAAALAPVLGMLFFAPPLLRWIGGAAMRAKLPLLVFAVGLFLLGFLSLGADREFRIVVAPITSAVLAVLSGAALARCIWRATSVPWNFDWFWVLLGMTVYYAVGILWRPLSEFLVARSWAAVVDLHMGMSLVHVCVYLLIARGAALRSGAQAEPPRWTAAATEAV
jgi:hypothetical protein